MNRAYTIMLGAVVLMAALFAGCSGDSKPNGKINTVAAASDAGASSPVAVAVFEAGPVAATGELLIPGVIAVEDRAMVLAQRDGIIKKLTIQEGARVTAGQAIAQLSDDDLREQVRQAEIEVRRLAVEERQYEAMIKVYRSELDQETQLFKDGLTSKRQLDRAQFRLDAATQDVEKTRLASQAAQSKLDGTNLEAGKTVIRAPISGVVTERYVHPGTSVAKNDKLFEISPSGSLQIRFQLPQAERVRFSPGGIVNLSLAEGDQAIMRARIRRIDPVADAASNTLGYVADLIDGKNLIAGLAIVVRVPRAATPTFWVPRSAFPTQTDLRASSAGMLFLVDGDKCAARTVRVKAIEGSQVEIESGLAAGDRVILDPPANLQAGAVVEIKK